MCREQMLRPIVRLRQFHPWLCILLLISVLMLSLASAQSSPQAQPALSELMQKNLSHVGAASSEIEPVLRANPGLLLELKAWVAREAANQGRLLTDSDLADSSIFERLRADAGFRSIATRLLQRYGYLGPELNPDSPAGKQQDYVMKERTKRQLAEAAQPVPPAATAPITTSAKRELCQDDEDEDSCSQAAQPSQSGTELPDREDLEDIFPLLPRSIPGESDKSMSRPPLQRAGLSSGQPQTQDIAARLFGGSNTGDRGINSKLDPFEAQTGSSVGLSDESRLAALFSEETAGPNIPQKEQPVVGSGSMVSPSPLPKTATRVPAQEVRVRNPFETVPSLYDMYVQAPEMAVEPKPFGADIFRRGTRASSRVPMDLPAGPDYVVGPGDTLAISMWGGISRRILREVDREGRLSLPEVGPVMVSGKTLEEAQHLVQTALRSEFREISADLSLSKLRSVRVYVVGEVARPGAYDISALSTALNALFVAGGPSAAGSLRIVQHYRGKRLLEEVDVYDLILKGVHAATYPLENGDTILVPTVGPQVTVKGAVRRPAIYELHGETRLSDVLNLAGGMLPTAALQHIEVQRLIAHQSRTMLSLDLSKAVDAEGVDHSLAAFQVQSGDVIQLFPIAPFNGDSVYLQGHVLRPGRYSYRKEMRLSDLISSYSDVLPDPAQNYAEIVRLVPPTYSPSVISFNLSQALATPAKSPLLQPLDTVRIFGKYDFEDPPTISVTGAVRRPGTYRTAGQVHVSDAIHLAGNLNRDASRDSVQVVHHQPDGTVQVMTVALNRVAEGDPMNDLLLSSGDRVLVPEDQNQANPAVVSIQGEVSHPGRYPLAAEMRVSDLIRLAGGLKRSADPGMGELVHFQSLNSGSRQSSESIPVEAVLGAGNSPDDKVLQDGDVLTIRRLAGWDDIGVTVTLAGELQHPGTYGFRPGERLSSVLKRAGGFTASAYPYGAVLVRSEVRDMQEQNRGELIRRLQAQEQQLKMIPDTDPDQKKAKDAALEQLHSTVSSLTNNPPLGRVVIHISPKIEHWANSPEDIQLRAGDKLYVPKEMQSVFVMGQVYNATAIAFRPGKSAEWYLMQAGGPSSLANKKGIFVIRADGSVAGGQGKSFWSSGLKTTLSPGDTVVVPEQAYAGGRSWQNALLLSQITSALTSTAYLISLSVK